MSIFLEKEKNTYEHSSNKIAININLVLCFLFVSICTMPLFSFFEYLYYAIDYVL